MLRCENRSRQIVAVLLRQQQLGTDSKQIADLAQYFRLKGGEIGLQGFSEMSDVLGIEPVGLGQAAGCLGELAHLGGVAYDHGQSGLMRPTDEFHFQASRGLNEDPGRL